MGFQLGVGLGDMVSMEGGMDIIRAVSMAFSWRVWPGHGVWSDLVGVVMGKGWAVQGTVLSSLFIPAKKQDDQDGQGHGQLQPPPVWKEVSDSRQQHQPHSEGPLVQDSHVPPVARTHKFCD